MSKDGSERRRALDGLRALAILAVFFSHTSIPGAGGGWVGVEIFFVLSGYLITRQLLKEFRRAGRIGFGNFYARRVLRLYPALALATLLGVLFYRDLGADGTLRGHVETALAAGFYLQDFVWGFTGAAHGGFGHTWSLAVEEQFYLLWPPLLLVLLRRRSNVVAWCLAAGAVSLVGTLLLGGRDDPPGTYFLPWAQAVTLLAGCALAAAGGWRPSAALATKVAPASLLGLGFPIVGASVLGRGQLHLAPELALAAVLTCALVAPVEAHPDTPIARLLSWRPLAGLGLVSYGFYLFYLPVLEVTDRHLGWSPVPLVAFQLVVTLALALASWLLVENRCNALKVRFPAAGATVVADGAAGGGLRAS